jgi:hypothetical protein
MSCSVSLMMEGAAQKGIALRDAEKQQQVRELLLKFILRVETRAVSLHRTHAPFTPSHHSPRRTIHPVAAGRQRQRRVGVILQNRRCAGLPPPSFSYVKSYYNSDVIPCSSKTSSVGACSTTGESNPCGGSSPRYAVTLPAA